MIHELEELFNRQVRAWPQLAKGIEGLARAKTRLVRLDWFDVFIRHIPHRVGSTTAPVDRESVAKRPCFLCAANLPAEEKGVRFGEDFTIYCNPFPIVDHHLTIGFNLKFTDLQAVIGLEQMKKLEWRIARKKEIYALYQKLLSPLDQVTFVRTDLHETAPWFIDVLVPDPKDLASSLKERGIGSRPWYPAIHSQPAFGVPGSFPNSDHVARHGLWLPSSPALSDDQIGRICTAIHDHYGTNGRADVGG